MTPAGAPGGGQADKSGGPDPAGAGAGLGIQFAASIVAGVLVGHWLDNRYGWHQWGVLGGALVGFVAGFAALIRAGRTPPDS